MPKNLPKMWFLSSVITWSGCRLAMDCHNRGKPQDSIKSCLED